MKIQILQLLEGAAQARGLTVIIDVLRAFSLECYLSHRGAAELRPVATLEEAFAWRRRDPEVLLVGERGGAKCEGFDYGNSPSGIPAEAVRGRRIIHTTSAGTQGVVRAVHAEEIVSGSLVNAAAVAAYLRRRDPEEVSLVCMGNAGVREAPEDLLCAEYIRSLVLGEPFRSWSVGLGSCDTGAGRISSTPPPRIFTRSRISGSVCGTTCSPSSCGRSGTRWVCVWKGWTFCEKD